MAILPEGQSKPVKAPAPPKRGVVVSEEVYEWVVGVARWLFYSAVFALLLIPFSCSAWRVVCGGLILGHFASALNKLINKRMKIVQSS
jgi:hypothetical protein